MLDGLDDIQWQRLGHAYGAADDVPDLLRALRSTDPPTRDDALGTLYTNVFHQGSRYEASTYAVPFLLELLADPATPDRPSVLALVTSLAIGHDENVLPDGFPVDSYRRAAEGGRELLAAKPSPWTGAVEAAKEYVEYAYVESLDPADRGRLWAYIDLAVYDAARAGVPLFRRLLGDPDPWLRIAAAYAVAWFPEEAAGSLPPLARATEAARTAGAGTRPAELATMLVASGLLGAAPDDRLLTDPSPLIRWATAIGRARVLGPKADPATVEELMTWTAAPPAAAGEDPTDGGWVPFLGGDPSGYAGLALRHLGPRHADRAFDALTTRLPAVSGDQSLTVLGEALRLAFPDGPLPPGTPAAALTSRQRRLVEVLSHSPEPWLIDGQDFGNVAMLVAEYGLPDNREALTAYHTASQTPGTEKSGR
ncbi:HEAT repeat domain-containing protein [Micromonospora avicenniae]|uniref:HEAT repeat domain-containing protein n=1 Tax=Micromonospora avicenniae TaxID=1198245 RepID=UPI0033168C1A